MSASTAKILLNMHMHQVEAIRVEWNPHAPSVEGDYVGCNTGNGEKLSYSQAEPGQGGCFALG